MLLSFTTTQKQRLIELDAGNQIDSAKFANTKERDQSFKVLNQKLSTKNKERLLKLKTESLRPLVRILESKLVQVLNGAGFVEVTTPTMLSKGMLEKMGITRDHPLFDQVYWLEKNTCLRPMLAPNLYHYMGQLTKKWPKPFGIFEIGQCFRKESKGAKHLSEFTMLNLVELGSTQTPAKRLEELANLVMRTVEVDYHLVQESSEVYGDTVDVVVGDLEVASGATGPHPLDINWNIADNWTGLGFGLERLAIAKTGSSNIRRVGRSLMYLDGARLNI